MTPVGPTRTRFLTLLVLAVLIPYASYSIACQIDPGAYLVGPYLLVAPMIACLILGVFFTFKGASTLAPLAPSSSLTESASRFAGRRKIQVYETDGSWEHPTFSRNGTIFVNRVVWQRLSSNAQEFALAHAVASLTDRHVLLRRQLVFALALLAFGVVASLNLWSILGLYVLGALAGVLGNWLLARFLGRKIYGQDHRALQLTGDLTGGIEYLQSLQEYRHRLPGMPTIEERIARLRDSFRRHEAAGG